MKSDITLTLERDEYVAGDVIRGNVCIVLTQEVRVKDLLLKINGQARVCWDEQRAYTKGSAPVVSRKNTETYLDHCIVLLRPDEGVLIPPGEHNFHFEFTLPRDLPSTYVGKWGCVRYQVKSVLERPWKFDIEREQEITVSGNFDLNDEPELLRHVSALGEFYSGMLCFCGGLINLEVRLSRRGYTSGEEIPFHVFIENNTGRKLHGAKISLVQHIIFKVGEKTRKVKHVLATTTKGEISPWKSDSWENDTLLIPSDVMPSTAVHVTAIQIKYTVTLAISYSTWRDEYCFPVPVFIGTHSFRKAVVQSYLNLLGYNVTSSPCDTPLATPAHKHNGTKGDLLAITSRWNRAGAAVT